jgi:ATP-binding cassette, subfamily B, bacterial CvaB/MchF/RaxB
MGINTVVGEHTSGLSSGQRQRILLARAMVERPVLLILDEATSHIDSNCEALIFRALKSLGMTIVSCAHRPEIWRNADRIVDMENGRIKNIHSIVAGEVGMA